jgi:ParB-like chromosome segregation protein Spo0J
MSLSEPNGSSQLRDLAVATHEIFMLSPNDIGIDPEFGIRDFSLQANLDHVRSLADNIKAVGGVRTPIVVRWTGSRAVVVSGECRVRASLVAIAEGLALKAIPAVLESEGCNAASRALNFFADNSGLALSALEASSAVARAATLGLSHEQIAQRTGKTAAWVREQLDLAAAPSSVKDMIRSVGDGCPMCRGVRASR